MNNLYMVSCVDGDYVNIVVAKTSKEAKILGANIEFTADCEYINLRVRRIRVGTIMFYEDYEMNRIDIEILEDKIDYKKGLLDWDTFLSKVKHEVLKNE